MSTDRESKPNMDKKRYKDILVSKKDGRKNPYIFKYNYRLMDGRIIMFFNIIIDYDRYRYRFRLGRMHRYRY